MRCRGAPASGPHGGEHAVWLRQNALGSSQLGSPRRVRLVAHLCAHALQPQEQEIAALEEAIRNRLAGPSGASGKAERLAAKKAAFSQDEWARISLYTAFMAREDEARRIARERAAKKAAADKLAAAMAEAQQRKCVHHAGPGAAPGTQGMRAAAPAWRHTHAACCMLRRGSGQRV